MKKLLFYYFIFIFAGISISAGEIDGGLNYLNNLRKSAGLITFKADDKLNKTAKNHLKYIQLNNDPSHIEKKGYKGFTGRTPSDRAEFSGYRLSWMNENSAGSTKSEDIYKAVDQLFRAVYHRLNFLNFFTEDAGIAILHDKNYLYENEYVFDMGVQQPKTPQTVALKNSDIIIWPYKNYYKTQPAFFNVENPDPLPECPREGSVGNPISIQFNPSKFDKTKFNLIYFKLFDINGKEIKDTKLLHQGNDSSLAKFDEKIYVLFPKKRLSWNHRYKVELKYRYDGVEKTKKWNFKTKSLDKDILKLQDTQKIYEVEAGKTYASYVVPEDCYDLQEIIVRSEGAKAKIGEQIDFNTRYIEIGNEIGRELKLTTKSGKSFTLKIIKPKSGSSLFVEKVYRNVLGREPDSEGLKYWQSVLQKNSAAFVAHTLFESKEFKNLNLDNKSYVAALYETILQREPDSGGIEYWAGYLNKIPNGRNLLFYKFAFSDEFNNISKNYKIKPFTQEDKIGAFIERFYVYALQREMDNGGFSYWKKELISKRKKASDIAKFFLLSPEFKKKNLSQTQYITILYRTFFDRDPSEGEIKYWSKRAQNEGREKLINTFLYSKEFKNIAKNYGIVI